jgi:Holliday junction resolvase
MGRSAQRKGADGERELANVLKEYGFEVRRGQVFNHESDMVGLDKIHPEVKRVEKLNVVTAMKQAITESQIRNDGLPTVFHRRNREEWLVTMRLTDWIELYRKWNT